MSSRGKACSSSNVGTSSSGSHESGAASRGRHSLRFDAEFGFRDGGEVTTSAASLAGNGAFSFVTEDIRVLGSLEAL